jgi:aryl-alcohol dehydrogenase-like predicted oxidoreductase
METRLFGRSGMHLSVLGFGCGAVGGLMVRGDPLDQERTIASAIAAGVNYFDTAVLYGNGESEKNLGRVLRNLKASNVVVSACSLAARCRDQPSVIRLRVRRQSRLARP